MPYPAAEVAGIFRRGRQAEGAATVNVRTQDAANRGRQAEGAGQQSRAR